MDGNSPRNILKQNNNNGVHFMNAYHSVSLYIIVLEFLLGYFYPVNKYGDTSLTRCFTKLFHFSYKLSRLQEKFCYLWFYYYLQLYLPCCVKLLVFSSNTLFEEGLFYYENLRWYYDTKFTNMLFVNNEVLRGKTLCLISNVKNEHLQKMVSECGLHCVFEGGIFLLEEYNFVKIELLRTFTVKFNVTEKEILVIDEDDYSCNTISSISDIKVIRVNGLVLKKNE